MAAQRHRDRDSRKLRLAVLCLSAVFLSTNIPGCARAPLVDVYDVRGVFMKAERAGDGATQLTLLHEAIPEFKGRDGRKQEMAVMAMTFNAAPSVFVEDLRPQDKVVFRLAVDWQKTVPVEVIEIQRLDPGLKLNLDGYSVETE